MDSLKYFWVKINRGGKESVEGVLESVTDDYLTLIAYEEVIRISMFHIRNVSYGAKIEKPEQEKKDKEENKQKEERKGNKEKNNEESAKDQDTNKHND